MPVNKIIQLSTKPLSHGRYLITMSWENKNLFNVEITAETKNVQAVKDNLKGKVTLAKECIRKNKYSEKSFSFIHLK